MQVQKRRKHRAAAPIGGIFVLLALIGVIAVVASSLNLTFSVLDNSREKEELAEFIKPVLMFDPVPFESPTDIDMKNLLLYSMWSCLAGERASSYTYNDYMELQVPASDLEVAAARLFGETVTLEHQSFGDYETPYTYDASTNMYLVYPEAKIYVYSPQVEEITRDGDNYNLEVSYLPPGDAWSTTFAGRRLTPTAEKTMIYVLQRDRDSYHIVKLQDPPSVAAAQSQAEQQAGEAQEQTE